MTRDKVTTTISMQIGDGCFNEDHNHIPPDNIPEITNKLELEETTTINTADFDLYDRDDFTITYSYVIHTDKHGHVSSVDLSSADNLWSRSHVDKAAKKLRFSLALKEGQAVDCVYFVWFKFNRQK